MALRIDKLPLGSTVTLQLGRYDTDDSLEEAVFLGIEGEGEDRQAKFLQLDVSGASLYDWHAYRSSGRWAYGSGADPIKLVSIDHTIAPSH